MKRRDWHTERILRGLRIASYALFFCASVALTLFAIRSGLDAAGIEPLPTRLEIGQSYEGLQDSQEALYYYEMVLKRESAYRDVAARVAAIKGASTEPTV